MPITKQDVTKLARLSRLEFDEKSATAIAGDLENILGFISKLSEVDTTGVEPTSSVLSATGEGQEISTFERADEVTEIPDREANQAVAPNTDMGFYVVPQVIE